MRRARKKSNIFIHISLILISIMVNFLWVALNNPEQDFTFNAPTGMAQGFYAIYFAATIILVFLSLVFFAMEKVNKKDLKYLSLLKTGSVPFFVTGVIIFVLWLLPIILPKTPIGGFVDIISLEFHVVLSIILFSICTVLFIISLLKYLLYKD